MTTVKEWTPEEIAALRRRLRLTQEEFGKKLGVFYTSVGNWEKDRLRPSLKHLRALDALDGPQG